MHDDDFEKLLHQHLSPPGGPNPDMANVEIIWVRGNPDFGADHLNRHGVAENEVEQVLFELPPYLEAKRHPEHSDRTIFWGATRNDRWLFISCVDWIEGDKRYLKPITAFEPEDGEGYWEKL